MGCGVSVAIPKIPGIPPSIPGYAFPDIPKVPTFTIPGVRVSLGKLPIPPTIPGYAFPDVPKVPEIPCPLD